MLSKLFIELYEGRRNPSLNPPTYTIDELSKYKDDPDVYISFRDPVIDSDAPFKGTKLGIYMKTRFNTPVGIYGYPLKAIWELYDIDNKGKKEFPYANHRPYIHVFKWNGKGKFIRNVKTDYSEAMLANDIEKLKSMPYIKTHISEDKFDELVDIVKKKARQTIPCSVLFLLLTRLSGTLNQSDPKFNNLYDEGKNGGEAPYFASLLRQLGYAGFGDPEGTRTIHPGEPYQGVFLSAGFVTELEVIRNGYSSKAEREPKISIGKLKADNNRLAAYFKTGKKVFPFEIAPKSTERELSWNQAMEYCKQLEYDGGGWRLPSKDELNLMYVTNNDDMQYIPDWWYWSSTESNSFDAWKQNLSYGTQQTNDKNYSYYVRAIRSL